MSTRTDWGLFKQDGSRLEPVAVGDAWHEWECPSKPWVQPESEQHDWTGEWHTPEPYRGSCPWRSTGDKREECTKCGMVFIYP